ncbi:MAG TPA: hypothetical protein VLA88_02625 [Candidatus Saccharimonadales bacterium]|nr:hypothetical protein [Candidatus Saccharimonadales bacterium]
MSTNNMRRGRGAAFLMVLSVIAAAAIIGYAAMSWEPKLGFIITGAACALSGLHFLVDTERHGEEDAVLGDWAFGLGACAAFLFAGRWWWGVLALIVFAAVSVFIMWSSYNKSAAFGALSLGVLVAAICVVWTYGVAPLPLVIAFAIAFVHMLLFGLRLIHI